MHKIIKISFISGILLCLIAILTIFSSYLFLKPSLPEINLVDESELQMPLKVFTKDGVLIGEFGEIKRRSTGYEKIPKDIKNAFLAAEDDNFFNHQGISYAGLIRSFIRCLKPSGCEGGGGTITMQVVRGYLLTREQTIKRKLKEIFLALELEGKLDKEEIFELYVNRIFLGNRSYGIEAASSTYFDKDLDKLSISESATIAAIVQLPSRINPIKDKRRTLQRRDWILSRMFLLNYISEDEYEAAILEDIKIAKNINLYDVDASYISELVRQEIVNRYGLKAYKEGWSVYTTIDSNSQRIALKSMMEELYLYDKRHGWREPENFSDIFNSNQKSLLNDLDLSFLNSNYYSDIDLNQSSITNRLIDIFDTFPYYKTHTKAIVIRVEENIAYLINENYELKEISWTTDYEWARQKLSINQLGKKPENFFNLIKFGDFVYLKNQDDFYVLDQVPNIQASIISINPNSGEVITYLGGKNFNESNFDRVRMSYPQSGSSFKPFIYSAGLANKYNLSSLLNDAPVVFEDANLESVWRPQNYTGQFYGPLSLRDALTKSVNIVSIKLLREIGIKESHDHIESFGFKKSRLPNDLSLALGSGNFSPAEMVRGYSVIANNGFISDMHFVDNIQDRNGNYIFNHKDYLKQDKAQEIIAFPWLDTLEMNIKKPYFVIEPLFKEEKVIDERIAYLIKDTLKGFLKSGVAGRKSAFLNRDDIAGKTGTTNDSVSTWFSGFHQDLVTTVWVGTDDFSSLGENEYGSTIALPIWLNYMDFKLDSLEISKESIPEKISFVRVNKLTGKADSETKDNVYFELFLEENIN